MLKRNLYSISLILSFLFIGGISSCTPSVRTTQSQQTWNEYKSMNKKSVKKAKDPRDKNKRKRNF